MRAAGGCWESNGIQERRWFASRPDTGGTQEGPGGTPPQIESEASHRSASGGDGRPRGGGDITEAPGHARGQVLGHGRRLVEMGVGWLGRLGWAG